MELRPYQSSGIESLRLQFKRGLKKGLLHLATGAGKTHCFSYMMIEAMQKGKRCLMVVRGRKLVDQASKRLFREGVTHGVLMAGHWNYRPMAPIQIASIDTLIARRLRPKADLIVIDECHQAISQGYKVFLEDYPEAYVVAVTATPYSHKSMRHIADFMVHPISVQELIDMGYLVPPRYFAPSNPNLSGIKVSRSTGDYMADQLAELMDKSAITGDIVEHWKRLGEGRPTLCFAVNIEHSKHLAEQFVKSGVRAVHCDADTPEVKRDEIIHQLEKREIDLITNVGIFCTGVDIPPIGCIIMARPTKSYNLYIQQAGRGTRPYAGKRDFILLDHAGNVCRHGFLTDEPEPNLDGIKSEPTVEGPKPRTCKECFAITVNFPCPICQWEPPTVSRSASIDHVPGELTELPPGPSPLERYQCERFCELEIEKCLRVGASLWKAFYKTRDQFGDPAARLVFFRICKRLGLSPQRKKREEVSSDGYPFK